jgi:acyl-CoA hydrolase
MNHHTLVLPEFINDQGNLFGGDILCFSINEEKLGNTSVRYSVTEVIEKDTEEHRKILFQTGITFVNVSPSGRKEPIRR